MDMRDSTLGLSTSVYNLAFDRNYKGHGNHYTVFIDEILLLKLLGTAISYSSL